MSNKLKELYKQYLKEVTDNHARNALKGRARPFEKMFQGKDRVIFDFPTVVPGEPIKELKATAFGQADDFQVGRKPITALQRVSDWLVYNNVDILPNGKFVMNGKEDTFQGLAKKNEEFAKILGLDEKSELRNRFYTVVIGDHGKDERGVSKRLKRQEQWDKIKDKRLSDVKRVTAKLFTLDPEELKTEINDGQISTSLFMDSVEALILSRLNDMVSKEYRKVDKQFMDRRALFYRVLSDVSKMRKETNVEKMVDIAVKCVDAMFYNIHQAPADEFINVQDYLFHIKENQMFSADSFLKRNEIVGAQNELSKFVDDLSNRNKSVCVLSRNRLDVLRMSDHKKNGTWIWTSCHSPTGCYYDAAQQEAGNDDGGAIAYMVDKKELDRWLETHDLQDKELFADEDRSVDGIRPISRVKIRRIEVVAAESYKLIDQEMVRRGFIKQELKDYAHSIGAIKRHPPNDVVFESIEHKSPATVKTFELPVVGLVYGVRPFLFFQNFIEELCQKYYASTFDKYKKDALSFRFTGGHYIEEQRLVEKMYGAEFKQKLDKPHDSFSSFNHDHNKISKFKDNIEDNFHKRMMIFNIINFFKSIRYYTLDEYSEMISYNDYNNYYNKKNLAEHLYSKGDYVYFEYENLPKPQRMILEDLYRYFSNFQNSASMGVSKKSIRYYKFKISDLKKMLTGRTFLLRHECRVDLCIYLSYSQGLRYSRPFRSFLAGSIVDAYTNKKGPKILLLPKDNSFSNRIEIRKSKLDSFRNDVTLQDLDVFCNGWREELQNFISKMSTIEFQDLNLTKFGFYFGFDAFFERDYYPQYNENAEVSGVIAEMIKQELERRKLSGKY